MPSERAPPPTAAAAVLDRAVAGIEPFLEELLADLEPAPATPAVGRPRILPAVCLWAGVLVCLLRGASSQSAVWRLLTRTRLWSYPQFARSDGAIYRRLDRAAHSSTEPPSALERLFDQVSGRLRERLAPYADQTLAPFAREVFAVDETSLERVRRLLPALRPVAANAAARFPGKLTAIFDLRRQLWQQVRHVPYVHRNEKASLPRLLDQFSAGVLLVFDRGYFSFAWFAALTDRQLWWVCRLRQQTSYTLAHVLYEPGDTLAALIWLGA